MATDQFGLIVEPELLEQQLGDEQIIVVDLSKADTHKQGHVAGARHLDYGQIVAGQKPTFGLLPETRQLSSVFSKSGLTREHHIVAYDDEGGGKAARLLWTLEAAGHQGLSLLNGGLRAWTNEQRNLTTEPSLYKTSDYHVSVIDFDAVAVDAKYIVEHLDDPGVVLLDTRTLEEFIGSKKLAERGGHIPGAVNLEWTEVMDKRNGLKLKPTEELENMLRALGLEKTRQVIVYCQTHHRSAHTYVVLKELGFRDVKGYPGAWSDWGNRRDLPLER